MGAGKTRLTPRYQPKNHYIQARQPSLIAAASIFTLFSTRRICLLSLRLGERRPAFVCYKFLKKCSA
ncbi:hypothetical protein ATPR_1194 [Acetobacter tropicalis NBRC 101654]|uniref:Uncharacterized protein n=1 Tax=Acetobacter tropicalis NBRC 101654 TaxID=749388 RepID=F7VCU5_9PROT|nr:hypothetical protein ATPR_1194 [Acetobacter tropicalis NBRC 101654]